MRKPNGGSAYPWRVDLKKGNTVNGEKILEDVKHIEPRKTIRDSFAEKAITGICADPSITIDGNEKNLADMAYNVADAMLEARKS